MNQRTFFNMSQAATAQSTGPKVETGAPFIRAHNAGEPDRTRPIDHLAYGKSEVEKLGYAEVLVSNIERAMVKRNPITGAMQVHVAFGTGQE